MFRAILFAAWTILVAYVFWRTSTVPAVTRIIRRRGVYATGGLLWASFLIPSLFDREGASTLSFLVETASEHLLAGLFLVATALLAVDVATGFGLLFRQAAPRLRGAALGAGVLLSAFALVQGTRPPMITDFEVRMPGLPATLDGTVVAALSDLHLGSLLGERWLEARVAQTMAIEPDMVVLLGDMVEGHGTPDDRLGAALGRLSAPLGVWAVTGNHESHGPSDSGAQLLPDAGIRLLHDGNAAAAPGLAIAGIDDRGHGTPNGTTDDAIRGALAAHPPGATILLSHQPVGTAAAAAGGAGLMLSGHTHGGQLWPFRYLVRLTTPYVEGRYQVGAMTLLVSRGTGSWGPRMRLFLPAEILRITLRAA